MTKVSSAKKTSDEHTIWFWVSIIVGFFLFLYLIRAILLPFVLAMATAFFLDPAADKLQKWGLSRTNATLTITAAFFLFIIIVVAIVVPLVAGQTSDMLAAIPAYVAQFRTEVLPMIEQKLRIVSPNLVNDIETSITSSSGLIARGFADLFGNALTSGMAVLNILSLVLITPVVAFYLIRDWDRLVDHIDSLLPKSHAEVVREQCRIIDKTLAGFVRGQLNVCLLLGTFYAIGLSLVGLNFGFVIGLVTGFLVIFPYVGLLVGMATGLTVAFFQFGTLHDVLMVLAVFVVGQVIEGNFVTPKLVGDKVGLHPVWIIFAMLVGATLFGFVGILLAVPIAAVLGVLVRFAIVRYQESPYSQ
jgi:predicted PurR-regulated permease PerM